MIEEYDFYVLETDEGEIHIFKSEEEVYIFQTTLFYKEVYDGREVFIYGGYWGKVLVGG